MSTLFFVNNMSWLDKKEEQDPLNEHFTFMAYNFIKYGLVDDAVFIRRHPHQKTDGLGDETILEYDVGEIVSFYEENPMDYINSYKDSYVYFWGGADASFWKSFGELNSDNYVLVNPMFNGIYHENRIDPTIHHFAIPEGCGYQDKFLNATVPSNFPNMLAKLVSKIFCDISDINCDKEYDWILVSSFEDRKQHIPFLDGVMNSSAKDTRGCIIGPEPRVLTLDDFGVDTAWAQEKVRQSKIKADHFNKIKSKVDILDNVELMLSLPDLDSIKGMLLKSRIFVTLSDMDNGPRAASEAALCGLPILTMPHIGAADLVIPGITGEIIEDRNDVGNALLHMIEHYDQYDRQRNVDLLKPENVYPNLIERIKHEKDIRSRAG